SDKLTGWTRLGEQVGDDIVKKVIDWLGIEFGRQRAASASATGKFDKLARAFIDSELLPTRSHPLFHDGQFYLWSGTQYSPVNNLDDLFRSWLRRSGLSQTNSLVNNTLPIIQNYGFFPAVRQLPCWKGQGEWPSKCITYLNGVLDIDTGVLR